jgi:hypothetical protein
MPVVASRNAPEQTEQARRAALAVSLIQRMRVLSRIAARSGSSSPPGHKSVSTDFGGTARSLSA